MKAIIVGPNDVTVNATITEYYSFCAGVATSLNATVTVWNQPVAVAGTVSLATGHITIAPGAGKQYQITLMVNGVASALTFPIANAATTGSDAVNTVAVNAGDLLAWQVVPTGTPTATGTLGITCVFEGTSAGESIITGGTNAFSGTSTTRNALYGGGNLSAAAAANVIPTGGTIDNLYLQTDVAPGAGGTVTVTLFQNGSATSLTTNVSGASQNTNNDTNPAHAVSFAAGDTAYVQIVSAAGTTFKPRWSFRWRPTVDGESPFFMNESTFSTATGKFEALHGPGDRNSTEAAAAIIIPIASSLYNLYFSVSTAPAGTANWSLTVRNNAVSKTVTASITSAITSATDLKASTTHSDSFTALQLADYLLNPTNTPATPTWMSASIVSFIQPPVGGFTSIPDLRLAFI